MTKTKKKVPGGVVVKRYPWQWKIWITASPQMLVSQRPPTVPIALAARLLRRAGRCPDCENAR